MSSDYFRLFVKREGKVVLGKNFSSLWLLTIVLTLTLLAISFSNASMNYLSEKMNDPFINWVEIENMREDEESIDVLMSGLDNPENKQLFNYVDCSVDTQSTLTFFGKDDNYTQFLSYRTFDSFVGNPIMNVILADDNVVNGAAIPLDKLSDNQIGVIIKEDIIKNMGYKELPAFIDYVSHSPGADTLGFRYITQEFVRFPIPVLAVVKRLPGNMNMVLTRYFYEQERNDRQHPFHIYHREYATSIRYFIPKTIDREVFNSDVREICENCLITDSDLPKIATWKDGYFIEILAEGYAYFEPMEAAEIDAKILSKYGDMGVIRVFDINDGEYQTVQGDYVSVHFNDLSKIKEFDEYVRKNYGYKIEMEQVDTKDTFNAVTVMANILSWSIVGFSIICIILYIVNLFQSYFQKVKRNIGTFKAFGISNSQLIGVYVFIMFVITIISIIVSLFVSFAIEMILPACGVMKDGTHNFLLLNSSMTWIAIGIILFSSIMSVYIVMSKLLSATPGNLIYDR